MFMKKFGAISMNCNGNNLSRKILENAINSVNIVGLWGLNKRELVDPRESGAKLVIMFLHDSHGYAYTVSRGSVWTVDGDNKKVVKRVLKKKVDKWRKQLEDYLGSGDVVISDTADLWRGSFTRLMIPLIRHTYPRIIAQELISVQPMSAPNLGLMYKEEKEDDSSP